MLVLYQLSGQPSPDTFVHHAAMAVEKMILAKTEKSIPGFVDEFMLETDERNRDLLIQEAKGVRKAMYGMDANVHISLDDNGLVLIMSTMDRKQGVRILLDRESQKIRALELQDPPKRIVINQGNIHSVMEEMEKEGLAGVVYVKIGDDEVIKKGFGPANEDLGTMNKITTVFGTGSRPIDYTIAAILLLDQNKQLNLDHKISSYFNNVPSDKDNITIRHLMSGQSGLPDFFHNEDDWNPDLQWVDRHTAIQRMFDQQLLFEPGTDKRHSHGAFGLLAALVEIVSDESYYDYIRRNFLDPAGMMRTGEYGETRGLKLEDFAAGGGPNIVGLPNIPPNWGRTSWLIKGSGGMYSTLDDLLLFYEYMRSGKVLERQHAIRFHQGTANLDGSDRGFELFNIYEPGRGEAYLLLNRITDRSLVRQLMNGLERFVVTN